MNDTPLFSLGQVVATPAALATLDRHSKTPSELIDRHASGDWGNICEEDGRANDRALREGMRILSIYKLDHDETVWVITESDRSSTCLLLPGDY
jgi:hypothetical protein